MATSEAERFSGAPGALKWALLSAVAGLVGWVVCAVLDTRRALFAYLTAYGWLATTLVGALALLMILHAARAEWPVAIRRLLESLVAALPVLLLLFIPLGAGLSHLYAWRNPDASVPGLVRVVRHQGLWWNPLFFWLRAALYLGTWTLLGALLRRWSLAQDADGALHWTQRSERLSAGGLAALAFTLTFAAFDWFMSLTPLWYSSLFGLYLFAGGFVAALALLVWGVGRAAGSEALGAFVTSGHRLALGKLLFAQVVFWGYLAFSQFFIVWIAHIPREAVWWAPRSRGWAGVSLLVALVHFAVPFALLLSRDLKLMPRAMAALSALLLVAHYLDLYWLVMPTFSPEGPAPRLADLAALLFVGGSAASVALMRARGLPLVARRAPGWLHSIRYEGT
jgi:hypothetical protein